MVQQCQHSVVQCGAVSQLRGKARFCSGGRGVFSTSTSSQLEDELAPKTPLSFGTQHPSQQSIHAFCHKRQCTAIPWQCSRCKKMSLMSSTLGCHMRDARLALIWCESRRKVASWRQTNRRMRRWKKWRNEWQGGGVGLPWRDVSPSFQRAPGILSVPLGSSLVQLIALCDPQLIMEADRREIGPLLDGLLCQWSSSEPMRRTMRWITWPLFLTSFPPMS